MTECSLFICNVKDIATGTIRDIFAKYGDITSIEHPFCANSRSVHESYAFLHFDSEDVVRTILTEVDNQHIVHNGTVIKVCAYKGDGPENYPEYSGDLEEPHDVQDQSDASVAKDVQPQPPNPETSIYVYGLPKEVVVSEDSAVTAELRSVLGQFGEIVTIERPVKRQFAFVYFHSKEVADSVLEQVGSGEQDSKQELRIGDNRVYVRSREVHKVNTASHRNPETSVYVTDVPVEDIVEEGSAITAELRSVLGKFGDITAIERVPRKPFAFVYFHSKEVADSVLEQVGSGEKYSKQELRIGDNRVYVHQRDTKKARAGGSSGRDDERIRLPLRRERDSDIHRAHAHPPNGPNAWGNDRPGPGYGPRDGGYREPERPMNGGVRGGGHDGPRGGFDNRAGPGYGPRDGGYREPERPMNGGSVYAGGYQRHQGAQGPHDLGSDRRVTGYDQRGGVDRREPHRYMDDGGERHLDRRPRDQSYDDSNGDRGRVVGDKYYAGGQGDRRGAPYPAPAQKGTKKARRDDPASGRSGSARGSDSWDNDAVETAPSAPEGGAGITATVTYDHAYEEQVDYDDDTPSIRA